MPSLDPSTWETPKEEFIGVIRVSEYSDTDAQKTKEGLTFTEFYGLPRPAMTYRLVVQRLDAVYKNKETGETSPILRFQDLQLERLDNQTKTMKFVTQGDNKNTYILTKFKEAKVSLVPSPDAAVGAVCKFTREGTHKFGGNMAKNLLYPTKVLGWMNLDELKTENGRTYPAVDGLSAKGHLEFEFNDDVEEIEFDPSRNEDGGSDGTSLDQAASEANAANAANKGSKGADKGAKQLTEAEVLALFVGKDPEDEDLATTIIAENKGAIASSMKAKLVSGELVEEWTEAGKLVIVDGEYALP